MENGKKKFSLFSAILSVICVVFVAEAAAPVAAIGNSQFFWWIVLIVAFLLPYGLITSELRTTYTGNLHRQLILHRLLLHKYHQKPHNLQLILLDVLH